MIQVCPVKCKIKTRLISLLQAVSKHTAKATNPENMKEVTLKRNNIANNQIYKYVGHKKQMFYAVLGPKLLQVFTSLPTTKRN